MMRKNLLIVFFLLVTSALFSQHARFHVSGRIVDAQTDVPLANVSVSLAGSLAGTLSDSAGNFRLGFNGKATLYVSMLGYQSQAVRIDSTKRDTLRIRLVQKANVLPEVAIHADAVEIVSKSKRYSVMDYAFVKEGILLIVYADPRKAKLLLLSRNLDTLAIRGLPAEPNRLFKDCLGNVHVVCSDSIYQAYYHEYELHLLVPKSVEALEKVLLPCIAQDTSNIYLVEKYGSRKVDVGIGQPILSNPLALSYISVSKKNHVRTRFVTIADERKITMSEDEDWYQAMKASLDLKGVGYDRWFAETILYTEVCAPLIPLHNGIYLFDFVNSRIQRFDRALALKQELPVAFHKDLRFQDDLQADPETQKVYARFETNGITELKEISLSSGEIIATRRIPSPLVTKVKVMGNYIYYIQKNKEAELGIGYLSRLRID